MLLGGGGVGELLVGEGRSLMSGIHTPIKEGPENSLTPSSG